MVKRQGCVGKPGQELFAEAVQVKKYDTWWELRGQGEQ